MSTNKSFLNFDRRALKLPRLTPIIAVFMMGLAGLILLHTQSRNIISPIEILLGTPQARSDGTIETRLGDVTVYMPPDATNREGVISITSVEPNPVMADDGWMRPTVVNIEFRSLDGTLVPDIVFLQPLEICFRLTEEQWQRLSQDSRTFQVQTYADEKNPPRWDVLPYTLHPDQRQLCGRTYNLSVFGLATKVVIPNTGSTIGAVAEGSGVLPITTRERRHKDDAAEAQPLFVPTDPPPADAPPAEDQAPSEPQAENNKDQEKDKEEKKDKDQPKDQQEEKADKEEPKDQQEEKNKDNEKDKGKDKGKP